MEMISPIAVDTCPRCHGKPALLQGHRYQVRCTCGACGPETRTAQEAARRWQSVTHYMRQHQAYVSEMLQVAVRDEAPAGMPIFKFARNR